MESSPGSSSSASADTFDPLKDASKVEIRELTKRYIFVDGKPLPQPLEDDATPLEGSPPPR